MAVVAGDEGVGVVLDLGVVDLVLLHGVDIELQRRAARIVVEAVVLLAARRS